MAIIAHTNSIDVSDLYWSLLFPIETSNIIPHFINHQTAKILKISPLSKRI